MRSAAEETEMLRHESGRTGGEAVESDAGSESGEGDVPDAAQGPRSVQPEPHDHLRRR